MPIGSFSLSCNVCQGTFNSLKQSLLGVCHSSAGHRMQHSAVCLATVTTLQRALLKMGAGSKCGKFDLLQ